MQDPTQQPQPLGATDEAQQAWTLHRLYPPTKRAAEIRQGIWTALLQGIPMASRYLKSVRVGSGTHTTFDGQDGRIVADGAAAALITYDQAGGANWAAMSRSATTLTISTAEGVAIGLNTTTGRGLTTSLTSYSAASDLMSATAISATTWTDLATVTGGFTPANANSTIWVSVRCGMNITAAAATGIGGRLLVDGTTAYMLSGGITGPTTSYINPIGGQMLPLGSFSAAGHTLKVQVWAGAAATGYCRASTQPNFEFLKVDVWEVRS